MVNVLIRAGCFVSIIIGAIILKRVGFFKPEDFHLISKIVMKITLPAAIISSFSGRELEPSMLLLLVFGFLMGAMLAVLGLIINKKRGPEAQSFAAINIAGCNIGNFVMPFAQGILGSTAVMAVCLFDAGNSVICLGGAYGIANSVSGEGNGFSIKTILKPLFRSVPFITYFVMTILSFAHISLPGPVTTLAGIIGNASPFMAMLMIGIGFNLSGEKEQLGEIARYILVRFSFAICLALLAWFLLPLPVEYRQALVIAMLAPVASVAPFYTAKIGGDHGMSSAINSFSILTSIICITIAMSLVVGV